MILKLHIWIVEQHLAYLRWSVRRHLRISCAHMSVLHKAERGVDAAYAELALLDPQIS